jgi:host factor-I protein
MSHTPFNIQDPFLNDARKKKVAVTVYLVTGVPIKGQILHFDNFVIIIQSGDKQQMIYKHAISTIIPAKPLKYSKEE